VIVTQTLPPGTKGSRQIDGIWVTDFAHACDLVTVVRAMVIMIHGYETANADRADKAGKLLDYIHTGKFADRVKGMEQGLDRLDEDLDQEMRLTPQRWKRREALHAEIRSAGVRGILLDIIELGGEIPPAACTELNAEDNSPTLPG